MGWTYMQKPSNVKAWIENSFFCPEYTVLDVKIKLNVAYVALQHPNGKDVTGEVILLRYVDGEMGYKSIPEHAEPYYFECPKSILSMLTLPEAVHKGSHLVHAKRWRERCEKNANFAMPKKGQTIKFAQDIDFGPHYGGYNVFTRLPGKALRFITDTGLTVKLKNYHIKSLPWELLSDPT